MGDVVGKLIGLVILSGRYESVVGCYVVGCCVVFCDFFKCVVDCWFC